MGAPNQKPSEADRNPLGRTAASAAGDVERLVRASVGVDDFVDVKCADYKWRKGHIVAVHEGKPPEDPRSRVLRCEVVCPTGSTSEPKTLVTELSLAVGSGRVARLGTFSDTWIHDYSAGQIVDCKDVYLNNLGAVCSRWRPAEVREVMPDAVLVHFLNWHNRWDTWFNMHCQAARIAPSGSRTGLESAEQRLAREVDAAFAEALLSAKLRVVKMAKDGSCLFRAVGYSIFGDPETHIKVRADIVSHMRSQAHRYAIVAAAVPPPPGEEDKVDEAAPAGARDASVGEAAAAIGGDVSVDEAAAAMGGDVSVDEAAAAASGGAVSGMRASEKGVSAEFEAYLERMSRPGSWGGDPELMAAEEVYDRAIVVFSGTDFEQTGIVAPMQRLDNPGETLPDSPAYEPIRLSYHGGRHYNAVERAEAKPLSQSGGLGRQGSAILTAARNKAFSSGGEWALARAASFSPSPARARSSSAPDASADAETLLGAAALGRAAFRTEGDAPGSSSAASPSGPVAAASGAGDETDTPVASAPALVAAAAAIGAPGAEAGGAPAAAADATAATDDIGDVFGDAVDAPEGDGARLAAVDSAEVASMAL